MVEYKSIEYLPYEDDGPVTNDYREEPRQETLVHRLECESKEGWSALFAFPTFINRDGVITEFQIILSRNSNEA